MKPETPNNKNQEELITEQGKLIEELQKRCETAEKRASSFESNWSVLFDQNKTLREENQKIQQGYESLRVQKGGFGFRMLMISGFGGFFTALVLCFVYLKLKPKPNYVATFQEFRREYLFDYELQLSQGDFSAVESSLMQNSQNPSYAPIKDEIHFTRKLLGAAKRYCQEKQHK